MLKKQIKEKLTHTHETIDCLYEQYYDNQNNYSDVSEKILYIVNQLPVFEQDVFYLYAELHSFRKVADNTNVSRTIIKKIIDSIKLKVKECKIDDFEHNYINNKRI
jgi:septation ring formation regulator EzrA